VVLGKWWRKVKEGGNRRRFLRWGCDFVSAAGFIEGAVESLGVYPGLAVGKGRRKKQTPLVEPSFVDAALYNLGLHNRPLDRNPDWIVLV